MRQREQREREGKRARERERDRDRDRDRERETEREREKDKTILSQEKTSLIIFWESSHTWVLPLVPSVPDSSSGLP